MAACGFPVDVNAISGNTKLITTCAVMLLVEEGHIGLDDSVEKFLPQLANRKVLRAGGPP